jgi:hypothetical protein
MKCYGFCGFTKLHLQGSHFIVFSNTFGIVVGATHMVVQTLLCLHTQPLMMVCTCMYAMHELKWIKYVVFESMDYMK